MKYYEIDDETTFNAVAGSLGTFRIRVIQINMRYQSYVVLGDCDKYPNEEIIIGIKDLSLFRNLVNAALETEEHQEVSDGRE